MSKPETLPGGELRRSRLPSGCTPIELLKHLAHDELCWLEWRFDGRQVAGLWGSWRFEVRTSGHPSGEPRVSLTAASQRENFSGRDSPSWL